MLRRRRANWLALVASFAIAMAFLFAGCSGESPKSVSSAQASEASSVSASVQATSDGAASSSQAPATQIAATILGHDISEDEVSDYIDSFRNGMQRQDDELWAEYLAEKGVTAQELRTTTIYELAAPVVVRAKANELGITVDEDAVDAQVNTLRHSLLVEDDEAWENELKRYGMTEEKLREKYSNKNLEKQVFQKLTEEYEPTDEDLQTYAADNLAGASAKKVVCVYSDDEEKVIAAKKVIDKASSVEEGMDEVKECQEELGVEYADVGWDLDATLTSNMVDAIAVLEKGQVTDVPLYDEGDFHLFYIEDLYAFPTDGSKVDYPDDSLKEAVFAVASASLKKAAGGVWLQQQIQENIVINDMPTGLSYDIEPRESPEEVSDGVASQASVEEETEAADVSATAEKGNDGVG